MTGSVGNRIFPESASGQSMRWSRFKDKDSREIFDILSQRVFPAIKNMKYGMLPDFSENGEIQEIPDEEGKDEFRTAFAQYMEDAMFLIPTPQVLQKIITGLEDLYENDIIELDLQGDLYEYMLGKLSTAGQNGQFRTPKHIREMMVALFLRMLKKGGRCACIVPDGVLFGSSKAHKSIRKELVENHQLNAVISMPSGVFKPHAGVSTAVLIFTKTDAGGTEDVWFYDMHADGYSLDDKRSEVSDNDIPDIIQRFHHLEHEKGRERTEQIFVGQGV